MRSVDDVTIKTIDRYRATYDRADGAGEEQPASYEEVAAWMVDESLRLARVAWAATHPLQPLSPEILIEAGKVGTDELHEILPELERFGEAILTQGDPARLGEVTGLGERVEREHELFESAMRRASDKDATASARHFAWVLATYLRMLGGGVRRKILAELDAALHE